MIARLGWATLALSIGHALAGLAYVGLINTPDANALMLSASALLLIALLTLVLLTSVIGVRVLHAGQRPWRDLGATARLLPAALLTLVIAGLLWWLAGAFESWWRLRAGEVDATAIAVGNVTDTQWLHATVHWTVVIVQWVLVPSWVASGLAWTAAYGARHAVSLKWLVVGLHPVVVLSALVAIGGLVWLPWQAVYWRPAALTSSTLEMAFTAVKLGLLYIAANLAWAIVLDAAARGTRRA